jgi:hypothetical protein
MLDVPGTYVGLMEAVVLARAGRGAESLNEITHDRPGAVQIPRNVLASKCRLDTVWRLGGSGCGRRNKAVRRSGSAGLPKAPKRIGT